jgi:hypothetical protein
MRSPVLPAVERRRLLAIVGAIVAVVLAVIAVLLLRSPEEIPIAEPERTPTPQPTPTPITHEPVQGEAEVETVVVSEGPIFFRAADQRSAAPETDRAAVDAFLEAITGWLDGHLTDLQDGGGGRLEEVAVDGLLDGGDAEVALGQHLTSFAAPVETASYRLVVAVDGPPEWAHVRVDLVVLASDAEGGEHREEERSAEFVFVPGEAVPSLLAAGPVEPGAPGMSVPPPPEEGALR